VRDEHAVLAALPGVLAAECPEVLPLVIDVPDRGQKAAAGSSAAGCRLPLRVLSQLVAATRPGVVAVRGERTWAPSLTPVATSSTPATVAGCWVVCNALEGPALTLVEELVADESAAVVLIEEGELPGPEQRQAWLDEHGEADPVSARLEALARLEAARPDLAVIEADLGDPEAAEETLGWLSETLAGADDANNAGNPVAGLVYQTSQGADRLLAAIDAVDPDLLEEVLGREARVLQALEGAATGLAPRCRVLLSGMQHLLHRRGVLLPAAVHALHAARATSGGWAVVGWESWQPRGANVGTGAAEGDTGGLLSLLAGLGPGSHLVRPAARAGEARPGQHERPQLATSFAGPRNEFERVIAEIWQELLGIDEIGVHDSFFDLGGDSLLATQITARLRQVLSVDVPLRRLLEGQTIAELATIVLAELTEDMDEDEMAELLTEVEG
jgi:acyl carrier protein